MLCGYITPTIQISHPKTLTFLFAPLFSYLVIGHPR
jgi:hypothetical protein